MCCGLFIQLIHTLIYRHGNDYNILIFQNTLNLQDRCHRIGQTRAVTVYKLFADDSVDQDIFEMGERKSKLSKAVLQDDRNHHNHNSNSSSGDGGVTSSASKHKGAAGAGGKNGHKEEEEEISGSVIGNILQRALLKRVQQFAQDQSSNSGSGKA